MNDVEKNLFRIKVAKKQLTIYLKNRLINMDDIKKVFESSNNYGLSIECVNYKNKILKQIFNCPFLLLDQDLSINIKKLLPEFLKYRYDMEISELDNLLELGQISEDEYINEKEILKLYYYKTSDEGRVILKKGKIKSINKFK